MKKSRKDIDKEKAKDVIEFLKEISPDIILTSDEEVYAVNNALNIVIKFIESIL